MYYFFMEKWNIVVKSPENMFLKNDKYQALYFKENIQITSMWWAAKLSIMMTDMV